MVAATFFEGYLFFSGESMLPIEEETAGFCEVAASLNQKTALCLLQPDLKFLQIMMGKIERTTSDMLKPDLARTKEASDHYTAGIIHFLRSVIAYIFCDFETAADEAKTTEYILLLPYIHPGFSCLLTFHCLALLAVAPQKRGLARLRLFSAVNQSIKKLAKFSLSVPENGLHSLNLVQAEQAAVKGDQNLARCKYIISIAVATKFNDLMIHAIACERFACFLQTQGDKTGATRNFREAHSTYRNWGAMAKVQQMEDDMPELLSLE